MAEPARDLAPRVLLDDEGPFSKFHQGQRRKSHRKSGCTTAIVTYLISRSECLANWGRPCTSRRVSQKMAALIRSCFA